jgi:hypothetical protein
MIKYGWQTHLVVRLLGPFWKATCSAIGARPMFALVLALPIDHAETKATITVLLSIMPGSWTIGKQ